MSDMLLLFETFFDGLLFLIDNTALHYLIGLCITCGVFAVIKQLITSR